MLTGSSYDHPSVVRLFSVHPLTPILRDAISVLSGWILIKLDTNIAHVSGHCPKVFKVKGQRSRSLPDQLYL